MKKKEIDCDLLSRFGRNPEAKIFSRMLDHSTNPHGWHCDGALSWSFGVCIHWTWQIM